MEKICFIQPLLSEYRLSLYRQIAARCKLDLFFSRVDRREGFGAVSIPSHENIRGFPIATLWPFGQRIGMYQVGLLRYLLLDRPSIVITFANPRYLSFWATAVWARMLGIPCYAHGHGLFKKGPHASSAIRIMYRLLLALVTGYICYTETVRQSMTGLCRPSKLVVADNSLENLAPVMPSEKSGREKGILFLGRLRDGCGIDVLIDAVRKLRETYALDVHVHVVGGGSREKEIRALEIPWVHLYGEVYDQEEIRRISLDCFAGCYPGDIGLSAVHYMSLSLPVIIHDVLWKHNPEASYVRDHINGFLFDRESGSDSLKMVIRSALSDPGRLRLVQEEAYAEFRRLVEPSLGNRILAAVGIR